MCPEYMVCEIQKCTEKPYGKESHSNIKMFILLQKGGDGGL